MVQKTGIVVRANTTLHGKPNGACPDTGAQLKKKIARREQWVWNVSSRSTLLFWHAASEGCWQVYFLRFWEGVAVVSKRRLRARSIANWKWAYCEPIPGVTLSTDSTLHLLSPLHPVAPHDARTVDTRWTSTPIQPVPARQRSEWQQWTAVTVDERTPDKSRQWKHVLVKSIYQPTTSITVNMKRWLTGRWLKKAHREEEWASNLIDIRRAERVSAGGHVSTSHLIAACREGLANLNWNGVLLRSRDRPPPPLAHRESVVCFSRGEREVEGTQEPTFKWTSEDNIQVKRECD